MKRAPVRALYAVKWFNAEWVEVHHKTRRGLAWPKAISLIQQWAADRDRFVGGPEQTPEEWCLYPYVSMELEEQNG